MRTTINLSVIILVLAAWAAALPIPNPTGPEVRANGASFYSFLFSSRLTIPPPIFSCALPYCFFLLAVPGIARNPQSSPPPPADANCSSCHGFG